MGEMADEAMYLGWCEISDNWERSRGRTVCIGDPKYDTDYWRDAVGTVRKLSDMDTMHLALVFKQLEFQKGRFYIERRRAFRNELRKRDFDESFWDFNLMGVALGLYCFYPYETDNNLEEYYHGMLFPYMKQNKIIGYNFPNLKGDW